MDKYRISIYTQYDRFVCYLAWHLQDFEFVPISDVEKRAIVTLVDVEMLRELPRRLPKIVIGDNCDRDLERAYRSNAIEYFKKPIDFQESLIRFHAAIGHVLPKLEIDFNYRLRSHRSEKQTALYRFFLANLGQIVSDSTLQTEIGFSSESAIKSCIQGLRSQGINIKRHRRIGWSLEVDRRVS